MANTIAVIILTFNEELHIARCIDSLKNICEEIFVVDSYSTDQTCEIAVSLGAKVYQHTFVNTAKQLIWAVDNVGIQSEWIWRVDADEYIEPNLSSQIKQRLATCDPEVNGVYVNKKIIFMGRPLLHGGWYPARQIKLYRRGFGAFEDLWQDEHIAIFSGKTITIDGDQTDENLKDLAWWTQKHNANFSIKEAVNMFAIRYKLLDNGLEVRFWGTNIERRRWLKYRYAKMPLFIRPFLNFFVRYVLWGGFFDGIPGLIWHVLQGFWYRFLVDAKIYEISRRFNFDDKKIKAYVQETYFTAYIDGKEGKS